ncbi:MAG: beta-lactamase family protein [Clostridia bacterium]|nr:beta-lactamase family protein [Clostridia bacterium]
MNFDRIVQKMSGLDANFYDFALYTPENGIQSHRFQLCNRCNNSYSVTKAFTMTAIGLLWDDGKLNVTDSLGQIFGAPEWNDVTIEHALTHRIGYGQGHLDIDVEDVSAYPTDDFLKLALSYPRPYAPGEHYQYTDAAFYLLSRVVDRVCGEKMDSLLWKRVLRHMNFQEIAWSRCPHEYPIGATGLYVNSEDMVKLGALYLNGGVWNGQRLISSDWVRLAEERGYELHSPGADILGKGGMCGQFLGYSPAKKVAFAWHAYNHGNWTGKICTILMEADDEA